MVAAACYVPPHWRHLLYWLGVETSHPSQVPCWELGLGTLPYQILLGETRPDDAESGLSAPPSAARRFVASQVCRFAPWWRMEPPGPPSGGRAALGVQTAAEICAVNVKL